MMVVEGLINGSVDVGLDSLVQPFKETLYGI